MSYAYTSPGTVIFIQRAARTNDVRLGYNYKLTQNMKHKFVISLTL